MAVRIACPLQGEAGLCALIVHADQKVRRVV